MTETTVAYIGLGANLGDAQATVLSAIDALAALPHTRVTAQSSLFRTEPVNAVGNDFINAVARLETGLDAHALLDALQTVEHQFGRDRPYPNAPRTLDLDLLLYGDRRIHDARLTVPHAELSRRAFVLIPLLQIDPFIAIPGIGPAHACVPRVAGQRIERLPDTV